MGGCPVLVVAYFLALEHGLRKPERGGEALLPAASMSSIVLFMVRFAALSRHEVQGASICASGGKGRLVSVHVRVLRVLVFLWYSSRLPPLITLIIVPFFSGYTLFLRVQSG